MSQAIDQEQVRRVATLARLDLTEQEIESFTGQLGAILEYVQKISELDTSGVEPLAHCLPLKNRLRDDVVRPSLPVDQVLGNAADHDEQYFRVPKILDDASGA